MQDEIVLGEVDKLRVICNSNVGVTPEGGLKFIKEVRDKIDCRSPQHYNEVVISPEISLFMPGKKDSRYYGDYGLCWNKKYISHVEITDYMIQNINVQHSNNKKEQYEKWIRLLEDVYYNGTINIEKRSDAGEKTAMLVLFWVTLQEDINKQVHLGRLRTFCRYAEALSTTQEGFNHTYEEVKQRMDEEIPEFLTEWNLPIKPSFYKWKAF